LAVIVYPTWLFPVPAAPLVIVIQGAVLVTLRSQVFELAVTRTVKLPPAAATRAPLEEKLNVHGCDCVRVKVAFPTEIAPVR
jgi:hypothetical protein